MIQERARFLSQDQFIRYCESLGMEMSPFSDELEFYESEGILFPAFRIIKPESYVRYFWQMEHDPDHPFYKEDTYECPDQWSELHKALLALHFPSNPRTREKGKELVHTLDSLSTLVAFLQVLAPARSFQPWEAYRIDVGEYHGHAIHQSTKEDYYQYWQAYEVFEIRRSKGVHARAVTVGQNEDGTWNYHPWSGRAGLGTSPYELRQSGIRPFEGWLEYFDTLSFFIDLREQEEMRAFAQFYWGRRPADADGLFRLTDEEAKELQLRHRANAISALEHRDISIGQWLSFLRDLARLHYKYEQAREVALVNSIKRDLADGAQLLAHVTQWCEEDIAERIGNLGLILFEPKTYWRWIFPDQEEKKRDKVLREFEDHREKYNQLVKKYPIEQKELDELIAFMRRSGTWPRFSLTMDSMYHNWFDLYQPERVQRLHSDLAELSAFPEHFWKTLSQWISDPDLAQHLSSAQTFERAFKALFGYASDLELRDRVFQWVCQERPREIRTAADFQAEWSAKDLSKDPQDWRRYITNAILTCLLVRNYAIHNLPTEEDVFQGRYRKIIDSVYTTVFVTWSYVRSAGLIGHEGEVAS